MCRRGQAPNAHITSHHLTSQHAQHIRGHSRAGEILEGRNHTRLMYGDGGRSPTPPSEKLALLLSCRWALSQPTRQQKVSAEQSNHTSGQRAAGSGQRAAPAGTALMRHPTMRCRTGPPVHDHHTWPRPGSPAPWRPLPEICHLPLCHSATHGPRRPSGALATPRAQPPSHENTARPAYVSGRLSCCCCCRRRCSTRNRDSCAWWCRLLS